MTTLAQQTLHPDVGNIIELFKIDASKLGGDVLYLTPSGLNVSYNGQAYTPAPLQITGRSFDMEGAPNRPTLNIAADRGSVLFQMVLSYGDLVGATVTYTKTFANFLDDGPDASPFEHFPEERFIIIQRSSFSAIGVSFVLATPLDQPLLIVPRRQILRDDTGGQYTLWCPGVSRVRRV